MPEFVKFPLTVRFPSLKAEGGSEERNVPARTARIPKRYSTYQPNDSANAVQDCNYGYAKGAVC
jgi:hypothetical protein